MGLFVGLFGGDVFFVEGGECIGVACVSIDLGVEGVDAGACGGDGVVGLLDLGV